MGFKSTIKEYFTFNRRERNGVFILLLIIFILLFGLSFPELFSTNDKTDFSQFEEQADRLEALQKAEADSVRKKSWNSVTPRIDFHRDNNKEKVLVELNRADTTELKKVKGIGSVFAARIVKFRDALGGFVSTAQLLEVYGMDKEKLEAILPQVMVDASLTTKLNVNTASAEDLSLHPYLNKKQAMAIFRKRVDRGNYTAISEIKSIALMPDSVFVKVLPYLVVQ